MRGVESPLLPGGTPQLRPPGRPAGTGNYPRGRRRRQPGSPDVSALRGGAADALLGPGRRLVLKGQCLVLAGGGGASCPCARPRPQGDAPAPAAGTPSSRWGAVGARRAWPGGGLQMAALRPGFPPAELWPVAPCGAGRRRPVIGRGHRECRTLSGRGRLCPCPPPFHRSKWVRSKGPGRPGTHSPRRPLAGGNTGVGTRNFYEIVDFKNGIKVLIQNKIIINKEIKSLS